MCGGTTRHFPHPSQFTQDTFVLGGFGFEPTADALAVPTGVATGVVWLAGVGGFAIAACKRVVGVLMGATQWKQRTCDFN